MLSMLSAAPGMARVFWRRSTAGAAVLGNTPGWQTVYRAAVRINGQPGALQVVSCEDGISAAVERMRAAWAADDAMFEIGTGTDIRIGLAHRDDRVWRFLLLAMPEPGKTVIFCLEQSAAEYRRSLNKPDGGRPSDLPAYPGSQTQLLVKNDDTRTALEVSTAAADPAVALDYFRDVLADQGYRALVPTSGAAAAGTAFLLYSKRDALCCVLARQAAGGLTTITVLEKTLQ